MEMLVDNKYLLFRQILPSDFELAGCVVPKLNGHMAGFSLTKISSIILSN